MLTEVIAPVADSRRTTLSTIGWWEARRLKYNVVVGSTGVFSLLLIRLITLVPPGLKFDPPWQVVVAYALAANFCYSFGWGVELLLKAAMGRRAPRIGPALLRQGIFFSVGLTLLPILIFSVAWVGHLIATILR
jgi:hypothetical protein